MASHAELIGDVRLGPDQPLRFLPSRFDLRGHAVDARGQVCHRIACPHCHLAIPHGVLELPTYFVSILGTPGCGKSVFLASMTWQLRKDLPLQCGLSFQDLDPEGNRILTDYEHQMFFSSAGKPIPMQDLIRKTQTGGDSYDVILDGDQVVQLPRPFLFALRSGDKEAPRGESNKPTDRILCLYDNAGEHFLAGADSGNAPVTHHLSESDLLLFLFDPLQHPRFSARVTGSRSNRQPFYNRQEMVLTEAAARLRKIAGISQHETLRRPLVVILTKADVWHKMVKVLPDNIWDAARGNLPAFFRLVEEVSAALRTQMVRDCPEVVAAAESLTQPVIYLPVSALGLTPFPDPQTGKPSVVPRNINPRWVTAPLVYALHRYPWSAAKFDPKVVPLK